MNNSYITQFQDNVKPCAVYLRKSRADIEAESLGEGETLSRHRRILTELARRRKLTVARVYEEIVSGESIDTRPQMQQLLRDVRNGMYAGVIVVDIDRLGRGDTKEQGIIAEAFEYTGTWIITPTKDYNPADEMDVRFMEFGQFMSRQEFRIIRKRLQRGLAQSVAEGNFVSNAPYGYIKVSRDHGKTKTLEPHPSEASIVKYIFEQFTVNQKTVGQIARDLTAKRVQTRTGVIDWSPITIRCILKNQAYIGKICWKKVKTMQELTDNYSKRKIKRRNDNFETYDGKHEPLISNETFAAAQRILDSRAPALKNTFEIANPLAGLIRCKCCGRSYKLINSAKSGRPLRIVHPSSSVCKSKSIELNRLLSDISDELKRHVEDFKIESRNDSAADAIKAHDEMVAAMIARQESLKQRLLKLYDLFETDVYSREEFITRRSSIQAEIDYLSTSIETETANRPMEMDYTSKIATFTEVCNALSDPGISPGSKNTLLRSIIDHCDYWREPTKKHDANSEYEFNIYFK